MKLTVWILEDDHSGLGPDQPFRPYWLGRLLAMHQETGEN